MENISVKEGETVNVGALLGVINGSTKNISDKVKEVKDYSPPKKQEQILKEPEKHPQVFKDEEKPLKLEEEPLILNDLHEERSGERKSTITRKNIHVLSSCKKDGGRSKNRFR